MEYQAVFQTKTQAKLYLLNFHPGLPAEEVQVGQEGQHVPHVAAHLVDRVGKAAEVRSLINFYN